MDEDVVKNNFVALHDVVKEMNHEFVVIDHVSPYSPGPVYRVRECVLCKATKYEIGYAVMSPTLEGESRWVDHNKITSFNYRDHRCNWSTSKVADMCHGKPHPRLIDYWEAKESNNLGLS